MARKLWRKRERSNAHAQPERNIWPWPIIETATHSQLVVWVFFQGQTVALSRMNSTYLRALWIGRYIDPEINMCARILSLIFTCLKKRQCSCGRGRKAVDLVFREREPFMLVITDTPIYSDHRLLNWINFQGYFREREGAFYERKTKQRPPPMRPCKIGLCK